MLTLHLKNFGYVAKTKRDVTEANRDVTEFSDLEFCLLGKIIPKLCHCDLIFNFEGGIIP